MGKWIFVEALNTETGNRTRNSDTGFKVGTQINQNGESGQEYFRVGQCSLSVHKPHYPDPYTEFHQTDFWPPQQLPNYQQNPLLP